MHACGTVCLCAFIRDYVVPCIYQPPSLHAQLSAYPLHRCTSKQGRESRPTHNYTPPPNCGVQGHATIARRAAPPYPPPPDASHLNSSDLPHITAPFIPPLPKLQCTRTSCAPSRLCEAHNPEKTNAHVDPVGDMMECTPSRYSLLVL